MPADNIMEPRTMTSPIDVNDLAASDFAGLRLSTRQVTHAAEVARAEYLAEYCEGISRRVSSAFRGLNEVFRFAQQANQAARL
ncbi:MAG: hypothetical protein ACPGRZ_12870 [Alphaproteobacteria bacterium]